MIGKKLKNMNCLLYTSDAADDRVSVDLGGRRIIKKSFFQAEDGIRDIDRSRGLGDVYKRQVEGIGEEKIFEGLELTADDWEEIEEYEYAFV